MAKQNGLKKLEVFLKDVYSVGFHAGLTKEVISNIYREETSLAFAQMNEAPTRLSYHQQESLQRLFKDEYQKVYWQDGHGSSTEAWFNAVLRLLEREFNIQTDLENIKDFKSTKRKRNNSSQ